MLSRLSNISVHAASGVTACACCHPGGDGGGGEGAGGEASGTQLQTTAEADAALDAAIESTIGALLESDGFGRLAESVVESEGVQRLVHNVESGDLCGDATTPSEMTACLLEGGTLLRSVSDATCAALKVGAAECEEVHRQAEALLGRFGLGGGGRFGALVMRALLVLGWRGAAAAAAALAAAAVGGCWWCWRRRPRSASSHVAFVTLAATFVTLAATSAAIASSRSASAFAASLTISAEHCTFDSHTSATVPSASVTVASPSLMSTSLTVADRVSNLTCTFE